MAKTKKNIKKESVKSHFRPIKGKKTRVKSYKRKAKPKKLNIKKPTEFDTPYYYNAQGFLVSKRRYNK